MNQMKRKMTRGVKAVVIAAIVDIVVMCICFVLIIWGGIVVGDLDAKELGVVMGKGIGTLVFPVATLILATNRKRIAMLITLVLSFTGGCINILCGVIALIFYFTDPNRKQYFEPYEDIVEAPQPEAGPQEEGREG